MQENKKTNKKTIIFQSSEIKAFCDALVQAKSKKTGVSIMRLIENALINEFGFKNDKLNDWCCEYSSDNVTTSYMSLLRLLPENNDIFVLYKMICHHVKIPMTNDVVMKNPAINNLVVQNTNNSNISDDKIIERIFMLCDRKDLDKVFYDFAYSHSNALDANPVPLDDIVSLLLIIDGRGCSHA
jgi:hypothetical protein